MTTLPLHRPLRVGHVPHDEPYVRRVTTHPVLEPVWPEEPVGLVLSAAWVRRLAPALDVVHLHLGLGDEPVLADADVADALHAASLPFVVTVHCLDRAEWMGDGLLAAADAVTVLTPVMAAEVRARWGRDALVGAHPHVADPGRLHSVSLPHERPAGPWRLGLHLRSCGPDVAAVPALDAITHVLAAAGGDVLVEVLHHERVALGADVAARLATLAADPRVDVRAVPPRQVDDRAVVGWVAGLDLLLLAAVRGSRSAWLELCRDVGTGAVAGALPNYVQQGTVAAYPIAGGRPTAAAVARAVERALARVPVVPVAAATRFREAARVREEHASLYRAVAAARPRQEEHLHGTSPW